MSTASRGIVFKAIKYSDTSLIVKIFSEASGLQSFLVKGVYGRKSKFRAALFQPMTLIEFVATVKPSKGLQYMSEIMVETPYSNIPFDMQKSAIVMFISELLNKSIQEEEANPNLFGFLHRTLNWLDLCRSKVVDFPLYFILELSRYLGFYPKPDNNQYHHAFDLMNGVFIKQLPPHPHCILLPLSNSLALLCNTPLEKLDELNFSNETRRQLMHSLIEYYQIHLPGFNGLNSHEVLRSVLD